MSWQIEVDHEECRLSGLCTAMAPDQLETAADGRPRLREEYEDRPLREIPAELSDAVECCPMGALSIVDNERNQLK